ncbi:hypothetical protein ACHAPT_011013 [Fusarium lateritium]
MPVGGDQSCHDACRVPLLEDRRRRPVTAQRTGRRRVLFEANAGMSSNASTLVNTASTRHTRIRQEIGGDPVTILNRLLNTLQESGIPGPQLFRLKDEFSHQLGQGGQGSVRGLDYEVAKRYRRADKRIHKIWPVRHIAIKQHLKTRNGHADIRLGKDDLSSRFRAAECEVLALSPGLFRDHPNIVKLVGWGLCLDTIEDPASPCCGGLQLPLLVFERAEMDFAQFLERLLPEPRRSDDTRAEEGSAEPFQTRIPESPPSWWSSKLRMCWTSLQRWSGLEPDPYEMVRLLCIDIGHGLRSLHENHFTHGDLKPENVLVFNTGGTWTAKLCDFGCAVGQDKTSDVAAPNAQKEQYLGTPGWLPSDYELAALGGFESLRKCDLYVYGLLVWSSFCLRGKHPRARPKLDDALTDLKELGERMTYMLLPLSPSKQWLLNQVSDLLKETLVDLEQRSLQPWTCLYRDSGQGAQHAKSDNDLNIIHDIDTTSPGHRSDGNDTPWYMTSEIKAKYKECSWWRSGSDSGENNEPNASKHNFSDLQPSTATVPGVPLDEDGRGPASSVALGLDDNCLSAALFITSRRQNDTRGLPRDMTRLFHEGRRSPEYQDRYQRLYYLARFRSRVSLEWWTSAPPPRRNILMMALSAFPPVEIHTLAWLCAGPVGSAEVEALDGEFATWESLMSPRYLNDSARLDRFLLLLQFGAPVDKEVSRRQYPLRDLHVGVDWESGTVFSQYLRSCRPAARPTIMKEIIQRLDRAWNEGHISYRTLMYFAMVSGGRPTLPNSAVGDLNRDRNYTAAKALAQYMAQRQAIFHSTDVSAAGESAPLFPGPTLFTAPLRHGWKAVNTGNGPECYEDEFTRSVTLTQPRISPIKMRQIKVGFLQNGPSTLCHVDLLSCMRAGTGQDRRRQFEQALESRFPYYDEDWFSSEWNREPNTDDVLKVLKEPWRIQTFTAFLRTPGLMDKMLAFLRMAFKVLVGGLLALVMAAILAAMAYAMWITFRWVAIGMIAWCAAMLIMIYYKAR